MTINDYQNLAMRTNDGHCTNRVFDSCFNFYDAERDELREVCPPGDLLNGALGLTGEAGEVSDMIKKHIFHGHELDKVEIVKELGDVCWYIALLCHAINVDMEYVMSLNIDKLKRRYPEGFSESASVNRTE